MNSPPSLLRLWKGNGQNWHTAKPRAALQISVGNYIWGTQRLSDCPYSSNNREKSQSSRVGWQLWGSFGQLCRAELSARAQGILAEVTQVVPLLPLSHSDTAPAVAPQSLEPRGITLGVTPSRSPGSHYTPRQEKSRWILTHCPSLGILKSYVDMMLSSQLQRAKRLGKMTLSSPWKPPWFWNLKFCQFLLTEKRQKKNRRKLCKSF